MYNQGDVYCDIISRTAIARIHSGHLNECRPVSSGRQRIVDQAANLTFESAGLGYYRPDIHPSPLIYYSAANW